MPIDTKDTEDTEAGSRINVMCQKIRPLESVRKRGIRFKMDILPAVLNFARFGYFWITAAGGALVGLHRP
jgi:hypothetical protein